MRTIWLVILAAIAMLTLQVLPLSAGPMPGAIFTTVFDGSRVNANIYDSKDDVYLDGGPGPNAPISAAGLDEGYYYFQVTDPSGKTLLSTDPVRCRNFHVNGSGIIDGVGSFLSQTKSRGRQVLFDCAHRTGTDIDHNAVTVQLMPYDNTPNNGGVYKVWVTPVIRFGGGSPDEIGDKVDDPSWPGFHGFLPAWSKTDNFKIKGRLPSPPLIVKKFRDCNLNGAWDSDEKEICGWPIDVTDPLGCTNTYYTPVEIRCAPAGGWTVTEAPGMSPGDCWKVTASILDDNPLSPASRTVVVPVAGTSTESHEVIFGNAKCGNICGSKYYDSNKNGRWDSSEPPVEGWTLRLTGPDGVCVQKKTGPDGRACFLRLEPGIYTLSEATNAPPCPWRAGGPTSVVINVPEDGRVTHEFGNYCVGTSDPFGTKGYWHNKNGLQEITDPDIAYVNGLCFNGLPGPYVAPSSYFQGGDEPFDGKFADNSPVAGAKGDWGDDVAPAGTPRAEISCFLVDPNAGGDPREQLAQQLLAFIFNCRHRLDGVGATILLPTGPLPTDELVDRAVTAWQGTDGGLQHSISDLLDSLNNSGGFEFIHCIPCPVCPAD